MSFSLETFSILRFSSQRDSSSIIDCIQRIYQFSEKIFSIHEFFAFLLNDYIFHAIDHRLQMENLSIFRENFFDSRIFRFSFKRIIFFTRSIIDHQIENLSIFRKYPFNSFFVSPLIIFHTIDHRSSKREFINFQKKSFRSTNSSLFF